MFYIKKVFFSLKYPVLGLIKLRTEQTFWFVVSMVKVETIVTMEMDETRTCSRSLEKQIFDRNILVLFIFFALFILWMILICSFDFAFHQKLMCVFYRLALIWELFASQGVFSNGVYLNLASILTSLVSSYISSIWHNCIRQDVKKTYILQSAWCLPLRNVNIWFIRT